MYFAILQLFYPLAEYLADVRYKCIVCSLWSFIIIAGSVLFGFGIPVTFAVTFPFLIHNSNWNYVLLSATVIFLGPRHPVSIFTFQVSLPSMPMLFSLALISFMIHQLSINFDYVYTLGCATIIFCH